MQTNSPLFTLFASDFSGYAHSIVSTKRSLKLIDLTTARQSCTGVNQNAPLPGRAAPIRLPAMAEALHNACPQAQGIYYSSAQSGPVFAILLFHDPTQDDIFKAEAWA